MKERAFVAHHIPGRIRIKLPNAKNNYQLLQQLKQAISPLSGIREVDFNSTTGSLIIKYEPNLYDEFFNNIYKQIDNSKLIEFGIPEQSRVDEVVAKIEAEAEYLSENSLVARKILESV